MAKSISRFDLQRRFALLSFICILIISSISALLLSNFLRETLLQRDAQVTMEFMDSVMQAQVAPTYWKKALQGGATADPQAFQDNLLDAFFNHVSEVSNVERANIFARDGTVIWSNNPAMIGERRGDNDELTRALEGLLTIHMGGLHQSDKPEHRDFALDVEQFVEYYIPIHPPNSDEVALVVELYKLPKLLLKDIERGQRLIWQNALLGGLFLYASLFWIVRRANHLIARQQQALLDAQAMAVVGETASVFAHGIRNPLASIRSSAELAGAGMESAKVCATDIIAEVDRLDAWIRELLAYTRDPKDVGNQTFDLTDIIPQCIAGFEDRFRRQKIEAECHLGAGVGTVRGDASLMTQVFISLISNATEAMPNGGRLALKAERVGNLVNIEIGDTGVGIPKDLLAHVFKPLVTQKSGGLGMGLPLAERALQQCGGALSISSEVGVGTTVRVSLQVAHNG